MERVQKQLQALIESGDLYEAQQVFKATNRRLIQRKQYEAAKSLLEKGATLMIEKKQFTQASELISLLISVYSQSMELGSVDFLIQLFDQFPSDVKITKILNEAITWSQEQRTQSVRIKKADPRLLQLQANRYWLNGEYGDSLESFLEAEAPDRLVEMLIDWKNKSLDSEGDLVGVKGVLMLLTKGNLKEANEVFDGFVESFETRTPILNFTQFLLLSCERDAYPFFQQLITKYEPSIQRDSQFKTHLDKIAQVFFRVNPSQQNNFLGDMLKSFLGGGAQNTQ